MWEIFLKIWFFIVILPLSMIEEGYDMLKKFMAKHGYTLHWTDFALAVLIIILIILFLLGYGYD